jgi:hypothetical protein
VFNALWFNAQELNGSGQLQRVILLESAVAAGVSAVQGDLYRRKGLAAAVSGGASDATSLTRRRSMVSSASAGAALLDTLSMFPSRSLRSESFVLTFSVLGASFSREMASAVTCGATAVMYPYSHLLGSEVSVNITTLDPNLTRTQNVGGTGATSTSADPAPPVIFRQCFSSRSCGAVAVGSPDYEQGGILQVEFGASPTIGADAECTIDPQKFLSGNASVNTAAFVAPVVNRYVELRSNPQLATASVEAKLQATRWIYAVPAEVTISTGALALQRDALLWPAAATTGAAANLPRISRATFLSGTGAASALAAHSQLDHYRGLAGTGQGGAPGAFATLGSAERLYGDGLAGADVVAPGIELAIRFEGSALCGITGEAEATVKLAIRLAADASGGASAIEAGYFTTRTMVGSAALAISIDAIRLHRQVLFESTVDSNTVATVTLWSNLYEFEPDYRTDIVAADDFEYLVEPQDFELIITDDGAAVKTFTKQPREILAYDLDLSQWFAVIIGDDIEAAACEIVSATSGAISELSIDQIVIVESNPSSPGSPAYRVKVWLSGGLDGVTYKLRATVDTEGGRRKEVDFKLKVKDA